MCPFNHFNPFLDLFPLASDVTRPVARTSEQVTAVAQAALPFPSPAALPFPSVEDRIEDIAPEITLQATAVAQDAIFHSELFQRRMKSPGWKSRNILQGPPSPLCTLKLRIGSDFEWTPIKIDQIREHDINLALKQNKEERPFEFNDLINHALSISDENLKRYKLACIFEVALEEKGVLYACSIFYAKFTPEQLEPILIRSFRIFLDKKSFSSLVLVCSLHPIGFIEKLILEILRMENPEEVLKNILEKSSVFKRTIKHPTPQLYPPLSYFQMFTEYSVQNHSSDIETLFFFLIIKTSSQYHFEPPSENPYTTLLRTLLAQPFFSEPGIIEYYMNQLNEEEVDVYCNLIRKN